MSKRTSLAALVLMVAVTSAAPCQQSQHLPGSSVPQFVDPLPTLDLAGGSIKTVVAGAGEIEIHMREFRAAMMPSTFVPACGVYGGTWVWGYTVGPNAPAATLDTYTGPVVVATRGQPAQFRFVNDLGSGASTNVVAWRQATDQTLHSRSIRTSSATVTCGIATSSITRTTK